MRKSLSLWSLYLRVNSSIEPRLAISPLTPFSSSSGFLYHYHIIVFSSASRSIPVCILYSWPCAKPPAEMGSALCTVLLGGGSWNFCSSSSPTWARGVLRQLHAYLQLQSLQQEAESMRGCFLAKLLSFFLIRKPADSSPQDWNPKRILLRSRELCNALGPDSSPACY